MILYSHYKHHTILHASCMWETCMQVKKQQLELDMEQWTGSKLGKKYVKAVYCHPAYLIYVQSTMWNDGLNEAQAGIKISGENINNLKYADDSTLMGESEEKLRSLLMKVKENNEKAGLKINVQNTKIMANRWGNNGKSDRVLDSKITPYGDCSHET